MVDREGEPLRWNYDARRADVLFCQCRDERVRKASVEVRSLACCIIIDHIYF